MLSSLQIPPAKANLFYKTTKKAVAGMTGNGQ